LKTIEAYLETLHIQGKSNCAKYLSMYISTGTDKIQIEDHFVHTNYPLMLSMFLLTVHLLFDTFFIMLYGIVGKKIIRNRNLSSIRTLKDRRKSRSNTSQDIEISHVTFSNALHQRDVDKNGNIELKGFKYRSEGGMLFFRLYKLSHELPNLSVY
jgi:hypothetical protein